MKGSKQERTNRRYAYAIGIGLALFPIHNKWLTDITSIDGQATLFIPAISMVVWVLAAGFYLRDNYKSITWKPKQLYIPLLVIVASIIIAGFGDSDPIQKLTVPLMGLIYLTLYLASRQLGKDIFLPMAIGSAIASFSVILYGIIYPGQVSGGFIFEHNYDVVVGYVLLGAACWKHRYQWVFAGLSLIAMFISGSPESLFVLFVVFYVVVWQNDWSKYLIYAISPVVLMIIISFTTGHGQILYSYTLDIIQHKETVFETTAINHRIDVIKQEMCELKPLGDGFQITEFELNTVHNVPLIIVQQLGWLGILAALAWLWVSIYCLINTKRKYLWVLMLSLGVFDHFTWTQLGSWWWVIVGISTSESINNDWVFRRNVQIENANRNSRRINKLIQMLIRSRFDC